MTTTSHADPTAETGLVCCPHPGCGLGDSGIHPVGVGINSGGILTDVDHAGTAVTRGAADGRGSRSSSGSRARPGTPSGSGSTSTRA